MNIIQPQEDESVYRIACMAAETIVLNDVTQTHKETNTVWSHLKWDGVVKNTETKVGNGACQGAGEERLGGYC